MSYELVWRCTIQDLILRIVISTNSKDAIALIKTNIISKDKNLFHRTHYYFIGRTKDS